MNAFGRKKKIKGTTIRRYKKEKVSNISANSKLSSGVSGRKEV